MTFTLEEAQHHLDELARRIIRDLTLLAIKAALSCDKSFKRCKELGNERNFGGVHDPSVPCPFILGDAMCGYPLTSDKTVEAKFGDWELFPSAPAIPPSSDECPECFGTGLKGGFHFPCSRGCPQS